MFYNISDDTKNYVVCRNTAQVVKLKVHVLQLLKMYKGHNIMKLMSRDRIFLSRDISVDLAGVLSCRATLSECLRHNHLSLRQVAMICFLDP